MVPFGDRYEQRPEALEFRTAPPASVNQRVHAMLSAASGSGVACLNIRTAAEVRNELHLANQHNVRLEINGDLRKPI